MVCVQYSDIWQYFFSEKELSIQQEQIAKVTQGIRERNFEPKPNEYGVCKWCDYKDFICPAWEE